MTRFPFLARVSLWCFLVYLNLVGGLSYPDRVPFVGLFHHLLLTLVMVGWLFSLLRHRHSFPSTRLDFPLLIYALWLLVTTTTSQDWRISLEQSWRYFMHLGLFYFFVDLMRRGSGRWLLEGLFLSAALVIIISVVELASWYLGLGFAGFRYGWLANADSPLPPAFYRLTLALNLSTWQSSYVVLGLPLVVAWMLTAQKRDDRQALSLVAAGLLWVLLLSAARSGFIGMAAALATGYALFSFPKQAWGRFYTRRGKLELAVIGGLCLISIALVVWISSSRTWSDQGRLSSWQLSLDIIQEHALTGVGVYQYGYVQSSFGNLNSTTALLNHAHNLYLNTGAELGIPGLAILAWVAFAFARQWWRVYQMASPAQQLRLIAVMAALVGFSIQSLFDTFTYTGNLLPLFLATAYVVAVQDAPATKPVPALLYAKLPYLLAGASLLYCFWLLRLDLAQFRLLQSGIALANDDYPTALARLEQAHANDPYFRLYPLHEAYILGRLAQDDPLNYLDRAIAAHENTLAADPAFDIGQVNLAALYAQRGDYPQAIAMLEQAIATRSDIPFYYAKLGEYYELQGDTSAALAAYQHAIHPAAIFLGSAFWEETPLRQQALATGYRTFAPTDQLYLAINKGWQDHIAAILPKLQNDPSSAAYNALGYYALSIEDWEQARLYFEKSLAQAANQPWAEAQLAVAFLGLEQPDAAARAAKRSLFLDQTRPPRSRSDVSAFPAPAVAYHVLARLALNDPSSTAQTVNDLLAQAVPSTLPVQNYDGAIFGHFALWSYLPQVQAPGLSEAAYAPWLVLAERYATDDDPETDPIEVYEAILENDPYVEKARQLCGAACLTAPPN